MIKNYQNVNLNKDYKLINTKEKKTNKGNTNYLFKLFTN